MVFVDYLLVITVMASGYFFIRFIADLKETGRGRAADILTAAFFLGRGFIPPQTPAPAP